MEARDARLAIPSVFCPLSPGGKGGSMMAFVEDKFIIKERHFACWFSEVNLVQELSAGDHKSLLHIAPLYGRSLVL